MAPSKKVQLTTGTDRRAASEPPTETTRTGRIASSSNSVIGSLTKTPVEVPDTGEGPSGAGDDDAMPHDARRANGVRLI